MTTLTVAITQMASDNDWTKNCDKAERLVREAAAKGAKLILLQELFDADYFCIEQHVKFLMQAREIDRHPTVKRFAALAKELGVVLPVSVFELAGTAHYNTTVIVDADGRAIRRSSISRPATPASRCGTRRQAGSGSASAGTSGSQNVRVPWR